MPENDRSLFVRAGELAVCTLQTPTELISVWNEFSSWANDGENPEVGRAPGRPSIAKRTEEKWLSGVWTEGFSKLKLAQGWQLNSTFLTGVQSSLHSIATGNNATIALVVFASAVHHLLGWWVCFSVRNLSVNISLSVEFCHRATAAMIA